MRWIKLPLIAGFRALRTSDEIEHLRSCGAERPEEHPDGFRIEVFGPAKIMTDRPLPHPSPDPISSSPSTVGAAAPPKRRPGRPQKNACIEDSSSIRKGIPALAEDLGRKARSIGRGAMRSKTFYSEGPQVSTNVQGESPVGSPSPRDSSSGDYRRPLGAAFKEPGTKLASEHHGGKAGRLLHSRCKCSGQMQYDAREEPFCTACGKGLKNASRMQSRSPHERMRKYKSFRMYASYDA